MHFTVCDVCETEPREASQPERPFTPAAWLVRTRTKAPSDPEISVARSTDACARHVGRAVELHSEEALKLVLFLDIVVDRMEQ